MSDYQTWQDEELQRLAVRREQGATFEEIGEELGRSANSCRLKYWRLRRSGELHCIELDEEAVEEVREAERKDEIEDRVVNLSGKTHQRLTSLQELYEFFEIPYRMVTDPETGKAYPYSDVYEVIEWSCKGNSWNTPMKLRDEYGVETPHSVTNFQYDVKARLRPRRPEENFEAARKVIEELIEDAKEHAPVYRKPVQKPDRGNGAPVIFEVCVFDPHIGMLAWGRETGIDYDSQIAVDDYAAAVNNLLGHADFYNVERILYVVGNDFLHVDGPAFDLRGGARGGATTAGTMQDVDSRLSKMFTTGRRALVAALDQAREIAPVDVMVIPGNHDEQQMYRMGEVLNAWYRNDPETKVMYGPRKRFYYQYGKNLLGFTHGLEFKRKRDNLALIMATESPPHMWASTEHREWHVGHNHIAQELQYMEPVTTLSEGRAIRVRSLPGLTPEDSWHYGEGYKHRRAASVLCFRKEGGIEGLHEFNLPSTRDYGFRGMDEE